MKCKICGKEIYGAKSGICRECLLESLDDQYCPVCNKKLEKEQVRRGFIHCSHDCYKKSEQPHDLGLSLNESNRKNNPWWNYKNFTRYDTNKKPTAYLYVVSTSGKVKVGITMYFYKRIEEVTRSKDNRYIESYIYRVYRMNTLDAAYLESYIHRMFPHENEYHNLSDLDAILSAVDNPRSWVHLNHLIDKRNPDLQYEKELVFSGTYGDLELEFKLRTNECNLSQWTTYEHKDELHDPSPINYNISMNLFDDNRLFELHDGLITHNCRLRLDLRELQKRYGGLFGSGDSTGSIGVVTINLPKLAYLASHTSSSDDKITIFYKLLDHYMDIAKESLEIKRTFLQHNILEKHLIPAFEYYVGTLDHHFSTIGLIGMNEMCLNLFNKDILDEGMHQFSLDVLHHMRDRLSDYQEETGNLYNLEASPAESTAYRLANIDVQKYPDIIHQGPEEAPYYTNSCHMPVNKVRTILQLMEHQNDLQKAFTGGTVVHCYLEGPISGKQAKQIIKTVMYKYEVPYVSLSPLNAICPEHGLLMRSYEECPICGKRTKLYARITGYIRPVDNYNPGKYSEFRDRSWIKV